MKQYSSPSVTLAGSVASLTRQDIVEPGDEFGSLVLPPGDPVITN